MNNSRRFGVAGLALLASLHLGSVHAAPVSVDFDGTPVIDLSANTYSEDGFDVTATDSDSLAGNGRLQDTFLDPGDTIFFRKGDGGLFQFASFTVGLGTSSPDAYQLLGFVNGAQVVDYGTFVLATQTGQVFGGFATTNIDELRLVGTQQRTSTPLWSQFVFDTVDAAVPEPATFALLMVGLAGIGLRRRAVGAR